MADRYWKLSKHEVSKRLTIAHKVQVARDALADLAATAIFMERWDLLPRITKVEEDMLIPAYIRPVKRWGGGDQDADCWYWDLP